MLIEIDPDLLNNLMYWLTRDSSNENLSHGLQEAFDAFAYKPVSRNQSEDV
jgi:hypothetical protein